MGGEVDRRRNRLFQSPTHSSFDLQLGMNASDEDSPIVDIKVMYFIFFPINFFGVNPRKLGH